jgi:hypothetical protein
MFAPTCCGAATILRKSVSSISLRKRGVADGMPIYRAKGAAGRTTTEYLEGAESDGKDAENDNDDVDEEKDSQEIPRKL